MPAHCAVGLAATVNWLRAWREQMESSSVLVLNCHLLNQ